MREIALDTETTGLEPSEGHRLVEIACVEMNGGIRTGRHFHAYVNPQRDVPADAQRIHGITTEFLQDKPVFADVCDKFLEFIGDSRLVIHNARFDMKFLDAEMSMVGREVISRVRVVDTLEMARKKFPGAQNSLDALCKRFGVDLSGRTFHGALLDSELLADVYLQLLGGRQAGLFVGAVEASAESGNIEMKSLNVPYRKFEASGEEKAAHRKFLEKKVKNAIWLKDEAADAAA